MHYRPAGTNASVVVAITLKSGVLQNSISFSTKCRYFIILPFSVLTNHALEFKYLPWKDKGFNAVFKLTPPWSPQAEDTRAPVCTICSAKVQSPRKPQCSQSVEAGMSDAGMNAARLLPVTLSPENIFN